MLYGVLSDIHGNLTALQVAVAALKRDGVDGYLCLGDIIGYGPRPNECVDLVASLGAICVAGNHELIAFDRLPNPTCGRVARETIGWTTTVLSEDSRDFLSGLPVKVEVAGAVLTHASLRDPQMYVRRPAQADQQLDYLKVDHPDARLLIIGHTHQHWAYSQEQGTLRARIDHPLGLPGLGASLLNPGSVGQTYLRRVSDARARFAILDMASGLATFRAVPYDATSVLKEMQAEDLPVRGLLRRQPVLPMEFHRARGELAQRFLDVLRGKDRSA